MKNDAKLEELRRIVLILEGKSFLLEGTGDLWKVICESEFRGEFNCKKANLCRIGEQWEHLLHLPSFTDSAQIWKKWVSKKNQVQLYWELPVKRTYLQCAASGFILSPVYTVKTWHPKCHTKAHELRQKPFPFDAERSSLYEPRTLFPRTPGRSMMWYLKLSKHTLFFSV